MANQGQPNASGSGVQTSSTARSSGRGTDISGVEEFAQGSKLASTGDENDRLGTKGDLFEPMGQFETSTTDG